MLEKVVVGPWDPKVLHSASVTHNIAPSCHISCCEKSKTCEKFISIHFQRELHVYLNIVLSRMAAILELKQDNPSEGVQNKFDGCWRPESFHVVKLLKNNNKNNDNNNNNGQH